MFLSVVYMHVTYVNKSDVINLCVGYAIFMCAMPDTHDIITVFECPICDVAQTMIYLTTIM